MKYWKRVRTAVIAIAVVVPMGFGVVQATASTTTSKPASCNAFACQTECAPFGGELGPGGAGEPLRCYCCG